jgi:hypothetical protein
MSTAKRRRALAETISAELAGTTPPALLSQREPPAGSAAGRAITAAWQLAATRRPPPGSAWTAPGRVVCAAADGWTLAARWISPAPRTRTASSARSPPPLATPVRDRCLVQPNTGQGH